MKKFAILAILSVFVFTGCSGTKGLYYWGDYSETLYDMKKDNTSKTRLKHRRELEKIINRAEDRDEKVAPGIYAEYGMMLIRENKIEKGIEQLKKEVVNYPESAVFIEKYIKEVEGE